MQNRHRKPVLLVYKLNSVDKLGKNKYYSLFIIKKFHLKQYGIIFQKLINAFCCHGLSDRISVSVFCKKY